MSRRQRSKRQKLRRAAAAPRRPDRVPSGPVAVVLDDPLTCVGCGGIPPAGSELCASCRAAAGEVTQAWLTEEAWLTAEDLDAVTDTDTTGWTPREDGAVADARACLRLCRGADELTCEEMALTALDALRLAVRLDDSVAWMRQGAA